MNRPTTTLLRPQREFLLGTRVHYGYDSVPRLLTPAQDSLFRSHKIQHRFRITIVLGVAIISKKSRQNPNTMDSTANSTGKSRLLVPAGPSADTAERAAPIHGSRHWLLVPGLLALFVVVVLTLGPGTNQSARVRFDCSNRTRRTKLTHIVLFACCQFTQTMRQPMIGGSGSKREGPWPECIGMTGGSCQRSIQAYAHDTRGHVEVLEEGTPIMRNEKQFVPERVRIWISADTALVNKVPRRG